MRLLLPLALAATAALAQGDAPPKAPEQAADEVVAALSSPASLHALAKRDTPDPWRVAEELCRRGAHDAADAFAKAAMRKDTEKLAAYVAARRGRPVAEERRKALEAVRTAFRAKDHPAALKACDVDTSVNDVTSVLLLDARATVLAAMGRAAESGKARLASAAAAQRIGWLRRAAWAFATAGHSLRTGPAWRDALKAWERGLEVEQQRGDLAAASRAAGNRAILLSTKGALPQAIESVQRSVRLAEESGSKPALANSLGNLAHFCYRAGRLSETRAALERALVLHRELGNTSVEFQILQNISVVALRLGDYERVLETLRPVVARLHAEGHRAGAARALSNMGNALYELGSYADALEHFERALKIQEELGLTADIAANSINIGRVHNSLSDFREAIRCHERGLELATRAGHKPWIANALANLATVHRNLGSHEKSLDYARRALALQSEIGDGGGVATTLVGMAATYMRQGDYPAALEHAERALRLFESVGARGGMVTALGMLGLVHEHLGAYETALRYQQRALAIATAIKNRTEIATALLHIAALHFQLGAVDKALDAQAQVVTRMEEFGGGPLATALLNLGAMHGKLGDHEKALPLAERALVLRREIGDRPGVAMSLIALGNHHLALGATGKARGLFEQSRALAAELGLLRIEVESAFMVAETHRVSSEPAEAVRIARGAVAKLPLLVGGLSEGGGASVRDVFSELLEPMIEAALALDDPAELFFFLESGRAGALLESLGGRAALAGAVIPAELRRAETDARSAVVRAQAELGRAKKRKEIRAARAALDEARQDVLDVVARIQRAAKAAANVTHPQAATLEEIQASLGEGDALVSYAALRSGTIALVVTRASARTVRLGKIASESALDLSDHEKPWQDAVARLRKALVEPLALGADTKRVLVSPAGAFAFVPFGMLAPDKEVLYVPSATTYAILADDRARRGTDVLALGDPDYSKNRRLAALPGTRAEAKAVGDVVLLGERASERHFRDTIGERERWRAVHLACHGLVHPERPLLSSLALTPSGGDDGHLTVLDVFRSRIAADLVMLSACETAKGKVYRTEGIVGFTRAFMLAGAPRVIVSLWKVDDEATRALMVKFYELWKTKPTATALKEAQAHVRAQKKWEHPYYWAAWQLWGLGD